jgi:hypothetical protein
MRLGAPVAQVVVDPIALETFSRAISRFELAILTIFDHSAGTAAKVVQSRTRVRRTIDSQKSVVTFSTAFSTITARPGLEGPTFAPLRDIPFANSEAIQAIAGVRARNTTISAA